MSLLLHIFDTATNQWVPATVDQINKVNVQGTVTAASSGATTITASWARPANTTAYAVGDVVGAADATTPENAGSAIFTLPGLASSGGSIRIESVELFIASTSVPVGMAGFRLHLFTGQPNPLLDNDPLDLKAVEVDRYQNFVSIPTPVDLGSTIFARSTDAPRVIPLRPYSQRLFFELQTLGGYTPASGTVYTLKVSVSEVSVPSTVTENLLWAASGGFVPSLDMPLAQNRNLIDVISGTNLVTFTRSSSGSFVGSNGLVQLAGTNVARFDHDPTTLESLGFLLENARTNLLFQSNQFNTTWANTTSSETAAAGIAPDGTNTAWELKDTSDAVATAHSLSQGNISFTSGTAYTFSCWMKAGTLNEGGFVFPAPAFGSTLSIRCNLTTGAVLAATAGLTGSSVLYPNGWVRVIATATATVTNTTTISIRPMNGGVAYIGTGTGTIQIFGAQLEAGAFATSYIPTVAAAVTRSADVADIINAAIANNIRTLYAEFRSPASGVCGVVSLNDGTANERSSIYTDGTDPRFMVVDGGVTQSDIDAGTITAGTSNRMAVRLRANDFAVSHNGGAVVTDTSGTLPTVDRIMLGRTQGGHYLNSRLARLVGWTQALPDSALQTLTLG